MIEVRLELLEGSGDWGPCAVCGNIIADTETVQAYVYDVHEEEDPLVGFEDPLGVVCSACLGAGPDGMKQRALEHAKTAAAWADYLKAQTFEAPTLKDVAEARRLERIFQGEPEIPF